MKTIAFAILAAIITSAPAFADQESCQDALEQFESAQSDLEDARQQYTDCTSSNNGSDDCSSEFEQLKSAQDDLENAISDRQSECNFN